MPNLDFEVTGVEAAQRGLTPLLHFKLKIQNQPPMEKIHTVTLQTQIQLQPPQRAYNEIEKGKLIELFGTPERWGQTLRNRLWGISSGIVRGFTGSIETPVSMPCTFDLNVAATKYFQALEAGEVSLLFLFSGSVFYEAADGRLQVEQISWDKECTYRLPVAAWQKMMEHHYPNSAWLSLDRGVFERLYAYKCSQGFANWDEAIGGLLSATEKVEVVA